MKHEGSLSAIHEDGPLTDLPVGHQQQAPAADGPQQQGHVCRGPRAFTSEDVVIPCLAALQPLPSLLEWEGAT